MATAMSQVHHASGHNGAGVEHALPNMNSLSLEEPKPIHRCDLSPSSVHRQTLIPPPLVIVNSTLDPVEHAQPPSSVSPVVPTLGNGNSPRNNNSPFIAQSRMQTHIHLAQCLQSINKMESLPKERLLSRPIVRKIDILLATRDTLAHDPEQRLKAVKCARSIGERAINELLIKHQDPHPSNLWTAIRSRGCQFLGPAMQEEVLKLVLLALEDGSALSRKVLVMFVVQRLQPHFPLQASKTAIGHVIQLLYRASCFKLTKRDGDSSLMTLKAEFCNYEALRREHDTQIVSIALEAGIRMQPELWSSLLYGDSLHKSHMQSIIDKLQTSFDETIRELSAALERVNDPGNLSHLKAHFQLLALVDPGVGGGNTPFSGSGNGSVPSSAQSNSAGGIHPQSRSPNQMATPSPLSSVVYPSLEDTAMALNAAQVIAFSLARFLDEFRGSSIVSGAGSSHNVALRPKNSLEAKLSHPLPLQTCYNADAADVSNTNSLPNMYRHANGGGPRSHQPLSQRYSAPKSGSHQHYPIRATSNGGVQSHVSSRANSLVSNGVTDEIIPFIPDCPTVSKFGPISPVGSLNMGASFPPPHPRAAQQNSHGQVRSHPPLHHAHPGRLPLPPPSLPPHLHGAPLHHFPPPPLPPSLHPALHHPHLAFIPPPPPHAHSHQNNQINPFMFTLFSAPNEK